MRSQKQAGRQYAIALIGVDYEEYKPETYKGVYVTIDGTEKKFPGKNFDEDVIKAQNWITMNYSDRAIFHSSSVDNFKSDRKAA
jgi:hypothetical protein